MESEELREMVERTYELTRKNNKMIKRMRRGAIFGSLIKIILWGAMAISSYWAYVQYMQPMMGSLQESIQQIQKAKDTMNNLGGKLQDIPNTKDITDKVPPSFMDALNMIKNAQVPSR